MTIFIIQRRNDKAKNLILESKGQEAISILEECKTNLSFMNNILLNLSYNYNKKTQESEKYYNSIFKANLSYKF